MEQMKTIEPIEAFAGEHGTAEPAHDFEHIHRIRNWALKIAAGEKYPDSLDATYEAAI